METQQLYLNNQGEQLKWCKECNQYLEILNFYHIYKNTHSTLCRKHTNLRRMKNRLLKELRENPNQPEKTTGFKKLPETVRTNILNDIANNKFSLMKISKKYDLKYPTLIHWNKTNQLIPV